MAVDDFTRADDPDLGSNWVPVRFEFAIAANEAKPNESEWSVERYSADTPPDDQESSVHLTVWIESTVDKGSGPACRISASDVTCYWAHANTNAAGEFQYGKCIAEIITILGTYTAGAAPSPGQKLAIRAEEDTLSMRVDDAEVAFTTDAAIASGQCGLWANHWTVPTTLANWEGAGTAPVEQETVMTWLVPLA